MNARQLLECLQALTPEQLELPVVLTTDCWQWELRENESPQVAFWTGEHVGTPATAQYLSGELEDIGQEYVNKFSKPCVAIGYINK